MTIPLYVFDAYGTLFDVHSAVARHRGLVGQQAEKLSEIWRAKQLEYSWTRSLMGAWRDFDALTEDALDFAAARCGGLSAQAREKLLAAYETLTPSPTPPPPCDVCAARARNASSCPTDGRRRSLAPSPRRVCRICWTSPCPPNRPAGSRPRRRSMPWSARAMA